jgi:hypothetical protein
MKTISSLLLTLAAASLCPAQEENPFLKETAKKAPLADAGASFLTLEEHILVPSDLLDAWLENHSLAKGAGELRAAAQEWIAADKAVLDHSALSAGIVGSEFTNSTTIEQIYATEYEPAKERDEWQQATSFETRNLGYTLQGDAIREQGQLVVRAETDAVRMLPHGSYDILAEATREPSDIFIPRFRSIRNSQTIPREKPDAGDPFGPGNSGRKKTFPSYAAGKVHLVLRADDDVPEPMAKVPKGNVPEYDMPLQLAPDRPVRLVFFRGEPVGDTPAGDKPLADSFQLSMRMIQVDQLQLVAWLQQRDLGTAAKELNPAVESWLQDGSAQVIHALSGEARKGVSSDIEDIKPLEYPSEYKIGKRSPASDGKPSQLEFAVPASFERRNVGTGFYSELTTDGNGPLIRLMLNRVIHGCNTVHNRILRDGKWEPNITFPRFSSNSWHTVLRPGQGEWTLVGSGGAFADDGDVDPDHTVLAFIKLN